MITTRSNIIAIDPGLHRLGVAVLGSRGQLRYSAVISTPAGRSLQTRLRQIKKEIDELLGLYRPQTMILEATWRGARPLRLVHRVARLCGRRAHVHGVRTISIPATTVRRQLTGYGWAAKSDVATVVASYYPELQIYLRQDRAWKQRYFHNLFDAVALGMFYQRSRSRDR